MIHLLIQASKYIMILLAVIYSFECFHVFRFHEEEPRQKGYERQRLFIYLLHFDGYLILFLRLTEVRSQVLGLYLMELILLLYIQLLYHRFYKLSSELVLNNMCMLLCIGMIMLTRISISYAIRQLFFIIIGMICASVIPLLTGTLSVFRRLTVLYAILGIGLLGAVAAAGQVSYGAKLSLSIAGISLQPSEFVKIIFVFFLAGMLYRDNSFKRIFFTSVLAAVFVLLLVACKDLGSALLYYFTYLMIIYVASGRWYYLAGGSCLMGVAGTVGYFLFSHVRTRVIAWKDPLLVVETAGYQVSQSLFGIGIGGWLGLGLTKGNPSAIPVVSKDYIFSAISEEMGLIFAICVILICISCFLMIFNISMQLADPFYKLTALGLGTVYALQVFLTIGGVIKFIPSTGVTLPLVSYGGSSLLSTMLLFGIIQGLYIRRYSSPHHKHEKV